VGNNRGSNSMGDSVSNWVGNGVGNWGNGMGNRVGNDTRSDGMGNWVSNHSRGNSPDHGNSLRVDSLSRVGHISNIAINVIGVVVDSLDPAIRKVDLVRSLDNTSAIIGLSSIEGGLGVVISHSIVEGVGGDLIRVDLSSVSYSMNHRSMGNSVDHRGSMGHGMNHRGPMKKRGGMDNRSMGDSVESRGGMN